MRKIKSAKHLFYILKVISKSDRDYISRHLFLFSDALNETICKLIDENLVPNSTDDLLKTIEEKPTCVNIENIIDSLELLLLKSNSNAVELLQKLLKINEDHLEHYLYFRDLFDKKIIQDNITYPDLYQFRYYGKLLDANWKNRKKGESDFYFGYELIEHFIFNQLILINNYYTDTQVFNIDQVIIDEEYRKVESIIEIYKIDSVEIHILKLSIALIKTNSIEIYNQLYEELDKSVNLINNFDLNSIFTVLINMVFINKSKWGKNDTEILDIYELMYEKYNKTFYLFINSLSLKNIATLTIRANKLDLFYKMFDEKTIKNLNSSCQNTLKLVDIKINFSLNKYQYCLEKIIEFKSDSIFETIDLRRLQAMCFYELNERVLVDNYLNTFKVYIHRNETLNQVYKESNNNFIRFLNRLNKSIDSRKVDVIHKEINESKYLAEKKWLLDKCHDLLGKLDEKTS